MPRGSSCRRTEAAVCRGSECLVAGASCAGDCSLAAFPEATIRSQSPWNMFLSTAWGRRRRTSASSFPAYVHVADTFSGEISTVALGSASAIPRISRACGRSLVSPAQSLRRAGTRIIGAWTRNESGGRTTSAKGLAWSRWAQNEALATAHCWGLTSSFKGPKPAPMMPTLLSALTSMFCSCAMF
jgi:hypothetical protein